MQTHYHKTHQKFALNIILPCGNGEIIEALHKLSNWFRQEK